MPFDYSGKDDFIRRISNLDEVSFVFGSALTGRKDDVGILEPDGIVKFINCKMEEAGYKDAFDKYLLNNQAVNAYQVAFEFIAKTYGADGISDIINEVMELNRDPNTGRQRIPKNVKDLVQAIKSNKINVRYIITTNFDTLIEEAFAEEGVMYNSIGIVSDSNINENANNFVTIVHIHGVWNNGDTMHTRNQLDKRRMKIGESLRNVIENKTICIMAYGGWEDSFTRMLAEVVNNNKIRYSLIWCFHSDNSGTIDREYGHIKDILDDAISRERVQFYKGIDCNTIFFDVASGVPLIKKP